MTEDEAQAALLEWIQVHGTGVDAEVFVDFEKRTVDGRCSPDLLREIARLIEMFEAKHPAWSDVIDTSKGRSDKP